MSTLFVKSIIFEKVTKNYKTTYILHTKVGPDTTSAVVHVATALGRSVIQYCIARVTTCVDNRGIN